MSFRTRRFLLLLAIASVSILFAFHWFSGVRLSRGRLEVGPTKSANKKLRDKELVIASVKGDDTSWLEEHVPDWGKNIYVTNDPDAKLKVPKNKGREAMVYLTFIIDNYFDLPEYAVFMHSLRYQWHNDDPLYDGLPPLQNLQLPYVSSQGYVSLRCAWSLGCPSEVAPKTLPPNTLLPADTDSRTVAEYAYGSAFSELFPGVAVPPVIGAPCCAQFAVAKKAILERPREDYQRYRQWLLETKYPDDISGRVLEYMWHIIFGKPPVHCPSAGTCYRNTFGLSDLHCTVESCEGRYKLPKYSTMPPGWPAVGWDS